MKLFDERTSTLCRVADLNEGDCFVNGADFYIVTDEHDGDERKVVNLKDGCWETFLKMSMVTKVDATLKVKYFVEEA